VEEHTCSWCLLPCGWAVGGHCALGGRGLPLTAAATPHPTLNHDQLTQVLVWSAC
jgi:hypothetical protein